MTLADALDALHALAQRELPAAADATRKRVILNYRLRDVADNIRELGSANAITWDDGGLARRTLDLAHAIAAAEVERHAGLPPASALRERIVAVRRMGATRAEITDAMGIDPEWIPTGLV